MKKTVLFICTIIALCSCGKSNEEKAKELIEAKLKTTMNDWSSYEFVKIDKVDSLFTSFEDSQEFKDTYQPLATVDSKIIEYEVGSKYEILYGDRIQVMIDSIPILKGIKDSLQNIYDETEKAYKGNFIGYSTTFTCRGTNKMGAKIISSTKYYLNKDITEIIGEESTED